MEHRMVFLKLFHKFIVQGLVLFFDGILILSHLFRGRVFAFSLGPLLGIVLLQMNEPVKCVTYLQILEHLPFVDEEVFELRFCVVLISESLD